MMRRYAAVLCGLGMLAALPLAAQERVSTRVLLKTVETRAYEVVGGGLARGFASPDLRALLAQYPGARLEALAPPAPALQKGTRDIDRIAVAVFLTPADARDAARRLAQAPGIEYAETEHLIQIDAAPNDSAWSSQWGTQRIRTEQAWAKTRGAGVVVGVIDTGIDPTHPDLRPRMWINQREDVNGSGRYEPWPSTETRGGMTGDFDGIDNDGNGVADDVTGYDFTDQQGFGNAAGGDYGTPDPDVEDEMGHGTSVSGIIAAEAGNGIGIAGVAPESRLMTLRAFDARGVGAEGDVARALTYAVDNGASVVNMSFGDVQYSLVLRDIVRYAHGRGVVLVASAGNAQSSALHYPSAYGETVSVGATASNDVLAGFSNYGSTVDLVAPGQDIVTTERGGRYASFNGTSASAPFVSGVAALIRALHPAFTPDDVRGVLVASARDLGTPGWDERYGAGLLDAERATGMDNPTIVRLTEPRTGFGTSSDTIVVIGTAASPYMTGYTLEYGMGVNPTRWTAVIPERAGQVIGDTLARWDVSRLADTTYTLRLSTRGSTSATLEDRVVVRLDKSPPLFLGLGFVPAIDNRHGGVAAGFITDEPTLGRIWYREKNSGQEWQWISAEGGTTNNLFVGHTHYAFLGENVLAPGRTYEFYFSARNETGLERIARDGVRNFEAVIDPPVSGTDLRTKSFGLPPGRVCAETTDFDVDGKPEALINDYSDNGILKVFEWNNGSFSPLPSAFGNRIPRGAGSLTGDGRVHLLASYVRSGFVYEAAAAGTVPSTLVWADSSGAFWPVTMADVTDDGRDEVIAVVNDSTIGIFSFSAAHVMTRIAAITNPSKPDPYTRRNTFGSPTVAIGDFNGNGRRDMLFGDDDGDFFIAEHRGGGQYQVIWILESDYIDGGNYVSAGDFDGDGHDDFALGLRTSSDDVIPFWYAGIYSLDTQNRSVKKWSQQFYGIEEAGQYGAFTRIQNSTAAANVDADAESELLLTFFPELYIVDYDRASRQFRTAYMQPLVNTNAAVCADFDGNGVAEIGVMTRDSITFLERELPYAGPPRPVSLDVEYISATRARIGWSVSSASPRYRLYKKTNGSEMSPFGEFTSGPVSDFSLELDSVYQYGISAVDSSRVPVESPLLLSRVLRPHEQPRMDSATYVQNGQVRLAVSQDVGPTIPPVSAFRLDDTREAESVSLLSPRLLLLSYGAVPDGDHGLRVKGLRDAEGIPFDEETFVTFSVANTTAPACYIEKVDFLPPDGFAVWFSGPVDSSSAVDAASYSIRPSGTVHSARFDRAAPSRVELRVTSAQPLGALGREYLLSVRDVRCASGQSITSGAGSTYALILNRATLDEMFVYPNPLRPGDAQEFVTFANLTPRATIRIYTVSGHFVREVQEVDGNGGTEWDLRDDTGSRMPGGVYVYHATGFDARGVEVGTKTGKFVIAR